MIKKKHVNKFMIHLTVKALGPEFGKAMVTSLLTSYDNLPEVDEFKSDFTALMEYFYNNPEEFVSVVQEYLTVKGNDEEVIQRVKDAMAFEKSDFWVQQSPEIREEKTLKSEAQRLTEEPKPAPRKTKREMSDVKPAQGRDPKTGRFLKKEA
jgi:hypothetical protein